MIIVNVSGPGNWPAYCEVGKKQSPINFNVTGNKVMKTRPFQFGHYGDVPASSYFLNNGTGVKFEIKGVSPKRLPQVRNFVRNCVESKWIAMPPPRRPLRNIIAHEWERRRNWFHAYEGSMLMRLA